MDDYHFGADLLDKFQSSPDAIKALMLALPVILLLGGFALFLHHLRGCRQIERDHEDLREARRIQRERWLRTVAMPIFGGGWKRRSSRARRIVWRSVRRSA